MSCPAALLTVSTVVRVQKGTTLVSRSRRGLATNRSVYLRDLVLNDQMEFNADNCYPAGGMSSDLEAVLCNPRRMMHRAMSIVGEKPLSYETALEEPTAMTS